MNFKKQRIDNNDNEGNHRTGPTVNEISSIMKQCLNTSYDERQTLHNIFSSNVWEWVYQRIYIMTESDRNDIFNEILDKVGHKILSIIEQTSQNGILLEQKLRHCENAITHYWTIFNNVVSSFYFVDSSKEEYAYRYLVNILIDKSHWLSTILKETDIEIRYTKVLSDPEIPYNMEYKVRLCSCLT